MTWIDLVKLQQHWWRSKKQQQGPMSLPTMTKVDEDGTVESNWVRFSRIHHVLRPLCCFRADIASGSLPPCFAITNTNLRLHSACHGLSQVHNPLNFEVVERAAFIATQLDCLFFFGQHFHTHTPHTPVLFRFSAPRSGMQMPRTCSQETLHSPWPLHPPLQVKVRSSSSLVTCETLKCQAYDVLLWGGWHKLWWYLYGLCVHTHRYY